MRYNLQKRKILLYKAKLMSQSSKFKKIFEISDLAKNPLIRGHQEIIYTLSKFKFKTKGIPELKNKTKALIQANKEMKAKLKLIKSSDTNERKKEKHQSNLSKGVNSIINQQFQNPTLVI